MSPQRIQRKRTKGWRMPEGAIYVGRPSRWGNPWVIGEVWDAPFVWHVDSSADAVVNGLVRITPTIAADLFDASVKRDSMHGFYYLDVPNQEARYLPTAILGGHDLACWCPLDQPCHADVLLELANQ